MPKSSSSKTRLVKGSGLRQLLSEDPSQFLLYAVEQVQEQANPRRVGRVIEHTQRRRETVGWVHVSATLQPCDLLLAARLLGMKLPEEAVSHRLQRIFDNGHMMHFRWQNYFMSLPRSFQVQISPVLRDWPIIGEADIIIRHKNFGLVVIELKSMNSNQFGQLRTADGDHRRQTNMYTGLVEADHLQVWYENKDNQETKTYWYSPDRDEFLATKMRVIDIYSMILRGEMPKPCGFCDFDSWIGDQKLTEERLVAMENERKKWLKKNLS